MIVRLGSIEHFTNCVCYLVCFNMVKSNSGDRFTDVDSTVLDGYVDESVPGSSPGSAKGLRASTRCEYSVAPKAWQAK